MWGRSRQHEHEHESMRGAFYDYDGRDRFPYPRPESVHRYYAGVRAERAAVRAQRSQAPHVYPADENYDEQTAAHAKFCHEHPEKCVPGGMTNEDASLRRARTRSGIARGLYKEHSEKGAKAKSTGSWHTRGTREETQRRAAHEPLRPHHRASRPFRAQVEGEQNGAEAGGSGAGEGESGTGKQDKKLESVEGRQAVGYGEDDEPWELQGEMSTTDHGQRHWQPHYFNHAFWSQLYHYFKGDKPTEYCNVCVGEFMTALQDIKDPSTGMQRHAHAEEVPAMCQGVCESNQALGYKFHRRVPTAGQAKAMRKRAHLLQHVAETEGEREERYQREYNAYVHAPPKQADYRVTRMEPTAEGAQHAGVLRDTRDMQARLRDRYGDRGYAQTNGGRPRRHHAHHAHATGPGAAAKVGEHVGASLHASSAPTSSMAPAMSREQNAEGGEDKAKHEEEEEDGQDVSQDMPVSAAVQYDLAQQTAHQQNSAAKPPLSPSAAARMVLSSSSPLFSPFSAISSWAPPMAAGVACCSMCPHPL
jgi:hypothetical protein